MKFVQGILALSAMISSFNAFAEGYYCGTPFSRAIVSVTENGNCASGLGIRGSGIKGMGCVVYPDNALQELVIGRNRACILAYPDGSIEVIASNPL